MPDAEQDEVCPYDGQTLSWHLVAEPGADAHPRTNAAFIGCAWPAELDGLSTPPDPEAKVTPTRSSGAPIDLLAALQQSLNVAKQILPPASTSDGSAS